jgi:hypothetical protein
MTSEETQEEWISLIQAGAALRWKRKEVLDRKQIAVAQEVGVHQSQISRLEQGELPKPKDPDTVLRYARAYQLTTKQTDNLLRLWYGIGIHDIETLNGYISRIRDVLHLDTRPSRFDYFLPLRYQKNFKYIDAMWNQLETTLQWLMGQKQGFTTDCLLVELAALLLHYLDVRGRYKVRIQLAQRAIVAAQQLEQPIFVGWFLCDALPWTLMQQYYDPTAALEALSRGIQIAQELHHREMEALAYAFCARVYRSQKQLHRAQEYIERALSLHTHCSLVVRTRIDMVKGEILMEAGASKREDAIAYFQKSTVEAQEFGSDDLTTKLNLFRLYLLENVPEAVQMIPEFQSYLQQSELPAYDAARIKFGLADIADIIDDATTAGRLRREAKHLLEPLAATLRFYPDLRRSLIKIGE